MDLENAIKIIDQVIAGWQCNRETRKAIDSAWSVIIWAAKSNKEKNCGKPSTDVPGPL